MSCEPTKTPAPEEIDIAALRAKYALERDRRIRREGTDQYVRATDDATYEIDPHMPVAPRAPLSEDTDIAILGGGWSGILAGYHLRKAGVSDFRIIDHAGDFGGVWYWNRYPGIQCDNDAYCYLPLLEETGFMPSKKFADGFEIQEYCRLIADKFGLYEGALFHTLVQALRWDEGTKRWRISTNRGDELRARFVIMANGLLNLPKLPGIPGVRDFKRKLFHTSRWDYDYTGGSWRDPVLHKLADKRVAIVGTGATAIQAVPYLGRYAKQLYVLQRTPSAVDVRPNPPTDNVWATALTPGWQQARIANFQHAAIEGLSPGEPDLICDFWTEIIRNVTAKLDAQGWPQLTLPEIFQMREAEDYLVMELMRRRIDGIVKDKATAEALKPYFRFPCKRPLSNNEYYETFNRPNVNLLDVSDTCGVERLTETGFLHQGNAYEIDCLICASGFEVTSDLDRRFGIDAIEGRDGRSLYAEWGRDIRTLHGMMTHGFPNQFFIGLYQGGLNATIPETFNRQGEHIAYILKQALARRASTIEPSLEAQDEWVEHIRATAFDISALQRECTPSYLNNEGDASKGARWYLGETYGPGWDAFQALLRNWRQAGSMEGLQVV
jgi:cation diffusion facilitator CzcD-associated flavoprotein CzcO